MIIPTEPIGSIPRPLHLIEAIAPRTAPAPKMKREATILYVEDESTIRDMAKMYLEGNGYRVIAATDGAEAVSLWQEQKDEIDLVLTDLLMPNGVNGHQLVERLKSDRPDLKAIFVSGYSSDLFGEEAFLDESTYFLPKPYRLKKLVDMVHDCLSREKAA